jgi:hypothetical protein
MPYKSPRAQQAYGKKYRETHREQRKKAARERAYEVQVFHNLKKSARLKGVPFNLTIDDIRIPVVCPVDGLPLIRGRGPRKSGPNERSPSADCHIPALGYIKGNVVFMSHIWNMRKSEMDTEQVRTLLRYMEGRAL